MIRSYVHDENAYSLGGVAGHAGLFSTAKDLGVFSQMMLNTGLYGWKRIFKPETVDLFTKRANIIKGSSRCLGWDSPSGKASGGVYLSDSSFGHTGFTGTSLWIDPENDVIVIAKFKNRNSMSEFTKKLLSMTHVERTNSRIVLNTVKEDFRFQA